MTSQVVIQDVEPRTQAIALAAQTVFNTNWTANESTDVLVYARASGIPANDLTQLVSSSNYVVTFVGTYQTVVVTFNSGRSAGDIITIVRATPPTRENLYTNTNFTPSMLNQDFGLLTLIEQQNQMYDQKFCPHYNSSCTYTNNAIPSIDLTLPILGANQFWVKNSDNTAIVVGTLTDGNLPASGPFITYAADAGLTSAFNLGLLTNGILGQTVSAGSATPYSIPYGTSGYVLTSNGAGTPPSFQILPTVPTTKLVMPGTIQAFAGTSIPLAYASEYLVCDGSAVSRATYAALFAAIGTTWGIGDGSTTFNLPNLPRHTLVGSGGSGSGTLGNAVGNTGGSETTTLIRDNMPSGVPTNSGGSGTQTFTGGVGFNVPANNMTAYSQGIATPINIIQPSAVVLYIIKT